MNAIALNRKQRTKTVAKATVKTAYAPFQSIGRTYRNNKRTTILDEEFRAFSRKFIDQCTECAKDETYGVCGYHYRLRDYLLHDSGPRTGLWVAAVDYVKKTRNTLLGVNLGEDVYRGLASSLLIKDGIKPKDVSQMKKYETGA